MSIQAVAWALEQDLPARPKLVLVSIANHANHIDGYCWLKAETIARESACTPRSIYRFVGGLVRNGYIRKVLRKGEDGKQRATDYWILLDREEKEWDWGAHPDEDVTDDDPTEGEGADTSDTISCEPGERISDGEMAEPGDGDDTRQPVDIHTVSPGPADSTFTRKRIAEPSESNSKASSAGARVRDAVLRNYRPPPPQPIADDTEFKSEPIFVFEGTPAYEAWAAQQARKSGLRTWHLTTRKFVEKEQKWRTGWYFPTLFPPQAKPKESIDQATGPPNSDHLTTQDITDFK